MVLHIGGKIPPPSARSIRVRVSSNSSSSSSAAGRCEHNTKYNRRLKERGVKTNNNCCCCSRLYRLYRARRTCNEVRRRGENPLSLSTTKRRKIERKMSVTLYHRHPSFLCTTTTTTTLLLLLLYESNTRTQIRRDELHETTTTTEIWSELFRSHDVSDGYFQTAAAWRARNHVPPEEDFVRPRFGLAV